MPTVHVEDFGAVGDGVTDDSPAIEAAIEAADGGVTLLDNREYGISRTILMDYPGVNLAGTLGTDTRKGTTLVALTDNMVMAKITRSWSCSIRGVYFYGNYKAAAGIWAYRAGQCVIEDVLIWRCSEAGFLIDHTPHDGLAKGSNNGLKLRNVSAHYCGDGLKTVQGDDNNTICLDYCNWGTNVRYGALIKGNDWIVRGGICEGNGSFAYAIGEDSDTSYNTGSHIYMMHPEGNNGVPDLTTGGIYGSSKSARNTIIHDTATQNYVAGPGAANIVLSVNAGSAPEYRIDGGLGCKARIAPGHSSVVYGVDHASNAAVYIRPKNSPVHLADLGGGVTIGGGSVIRKHLRYAYEWPEGYRGSHLDVEAPEVKPGDVVHVNHEDLGDSLVYLVGSVVSPGKVRVLALGPELGRIPPGDFYLTVWQY